MKRLLTWIGIALATLLLAFGVLAAVAWWHGARALTRTYPVQDPPLQVPSDASALGHGEHLFRSRGCAECHGDGGEGRELFDAGPIARIVPSNITPAALAGRYDDDAVAAAIRHGVRADGTALVFMPSGDYAGLSDSDTAALVAYLRTLPDSSNDPGPTEARIGARVLHLFGAFPLTPAAHLDHRPRARSAPPAAATAEYGAYVAEVCSNCHGREFSGGLVHGPGAPPSANLTLHADGLANWSESDFVRALREGLRPDGRRLDPLMPVAMTAAMTDTELAAMWAYFRMLPAQPMPR